VSCQTHGGKFFVSCTGKIFVCGGNVCVTHGGKIFVSRTGKIMVCGGNVCVTETKIKIIKVWSVMRRPSRMDVRGTYGPLALAVASDCCHDKFVDRLDSPIYIGRHACVMRC
jgi:hypothetical protein